MRGGLKSFWALEWYSNETGAIFVGMQQGGLQNTRSRSVLAIEMSKSASWVFFFVSMADFAGEVTVLCMSIAIKEQNLSRTLKPTI